MSEGDQAVLSRLALCPTATLCDAYIKSGLRRPERMFMAGCRPLHSSASIVAGRAKTKLLEIVRDPARSSTVSDREKAMHQVDTCGPGDFLVVAAPRALPYAIWGGHLTLQTSLRGAVGVIADGLARDSGEIAELGFPVWCSGVTPIPSGYGGYSVKDNDVPVTCAGVEVMPGDYLVGDQDGVLLVPRPEVEDLLAVCEEMERQEKLAAEKLRAGSTMVDAYVSRSYYQDGKD